MGSQPAPAGNAEVGAVLAAKAREGASGILELDGDPAGAIHLDRGAITSAWSSWCQPLGDQLGDVSRSDVLAAVTTLTMPLDPDAQPPLIRFVQPGRCWASGPCRLAADEVLALAAEHARRILSLGICPSSKISLCDVQCPTVVVRRDQWAVASRIDRGLPLRDLADAAGIALFHTLESAGELVSAGLCSVTRSVPPGSLRARQGSLAEVGILPPDPQAPDVLHRVLDGLRRLS